MDGEVILDEDSIGIIKQARNLTDLPLHSPVKEGGFKNPLPWREKEGRGGFVGLGGTGH